VVCQRSVLRLTKGDERGKKTEGRVACRLNTKHDKSSLPATGPRGKGGESGGLRM
jgi:hypothetical protein